MKNPEPPASWPCECPPSRPSEYLAVCRILSEVGDVSMDELVKPEVSKWLEHCPPGHHRRITLKDDAVVSTINRLAAPTWRSWLDHNHEACAVVCTVVLQLKVRHQIDEQIADKVSASLVARRLIQFVASGQTNVFALGMAGIHSVKPMLPPPWWVPPAGCGFEESCIGAFRSVRSSAWHDFQRDVERFWSANPWRDHREVSTTDEQEETELRKERPQPFFMIEDFEGRLRIRGRAPAVAITETEEGVLRVPVSKSRRSCFAAVACLQTQLAPSFREVPSAIRTLQFLNSVTNERLDNEQARDAALAAIVVLAGVPPVDVLNFGMSGMVTKAGAITADGLIINVGSGYYPTMVGRVPMQQVRLRFPTTYELLVGEFISRYPEAMRVSDCFEKFPLDRLLNFLATVGRSVPTEAKFLHRAFIYAARRLVDVPAGIFALLIGRPIGPFRSASNYQMSSETLVWLGKTQSCLLHLANLPADCSSWAIPGEVYGPDVCTLSEAVTTARKQLDTVVNKNQAAAALELAFAFHGRRPSVDKPNVPASVVKCGVEMGLLIADKNHGGGRRLRLIPAHADLEQLK
ncbi:hypothetical protein BH09VER1_BH09VER1_47660 [soil metagenome]